MPDPGAIGRHPREHRTLGTLVTCSNSSWRSKSFPRMECNCSRVRGRGNSPASPVRTSFPPKITGSRPFAPMTSVASRRGGRALEEQHRLGLLDVEERPRRGRCRRRAHHPARADRGCAVEDGSVLFPIGQLLTIEPADGDGARDASRRAARIRRRPRSGPWRPQARKKERSAFIVKLPRSRCGALRPRPRASRKGRASTGPVVRSPLGENTRLFDCTYVQYYERDGCRLRATVVTVGRSRFCHVIATTQVRPQENKAGNRLWRKK